MEKDDGKVMKGFFEKKVTWIFENVTQNGSGSYTIIITHSNKRFKFRFI